MQLILIFIVIAGGMGLSIEAGLLGPLGGEVGDLWATFSIFGVGAALTFLLMLFQPAQQSVVLCATSMAAAWRRAWADLRHHPDRSNAGNRHRHDYDRHRQAVFKSLIIDHFGLLGTSRRKIDSKRIIALIFIIAALVMVAQG